MAVPRGAWALLWALLALAWAAGQETGEKVSAPPEPIPQAQGCPPSLSRPPVRPSVRLSPCFPSAKNPLGAGGGRAPRRLDNLGQSGVKHPVV